MAFKNFPQTLKVKVLETGEIVSGGGLTTGHHQDLVYVVLGLYIQGSAAGTEKLRVKLFSDSSLTKLYATSAWSAVSGISNLAANWLGWLRFDFKGEPLNGNLQYWLAVESTGYARNHDAFYIGLLKDWGLSLSGNPDALAAAVYGSRWVA